MGYLSNKSDAGLSKAQIVNYLMTLHMRLT